MVEKSSGDSVLPFASHFVDVQGYRMHYLDEGQGPVVLLLHGNPTWCFYYRNLIEQLKTNFRVIAPDHIGLGLSERPANRSFRAIERVHHLQDFIEILGLEKFSMVMHDWGGPIGTGLAVRSVESLEKLVYLNTTLSEMETLPAVIKRAAHPLIGKVITKYTKHFLKLTTTFGVSKRLSSEIRRGYYQPYPSVSDRAAIWDFVADIPFSDTHPSYADMLDMASKLPSLSDVPVKIIWGLKDPCFHKGMLSEVVKHFPHSEVLEIPSASHLVLEDAPELVGSVIDEFLQRKKDSAGVAPESSEEAATKGANVLYSSFMKRAESGQMHDAVIVPEFRLGKVRYAHHTARELSTKISAYQRGLVELGLRPADRVLMLVPPGIEFLALAYAVMGRGGIPIFVDPGIGKKNLFRCIRDANPQALIAVPRGQLLRLKKKELFPELRFHLTVSDWCYTGGPTLRWLKRFTSAPLPEVEAPETGLIAFTSGATGVPKGVVFTNEMLSAQIDIFTEVFGFAPRNKDLPLLPIFSLFSLAVGVCSVFPPMDNSRPLSLDPQKIVRIISDLDIDYSFGSPTLWNKIAEYCVRSSTELRSIKKIFVAGAPVSEQTLKRVQGILPNGELYTPYGATEALPVTLISSEDILATEKAPALSGEMGTLVGKAVATVDLKVVETKDTAFSSLEESKELPPFTVGEVIVRGKNVSPRYLNNSQATQDGKIPDAQGFWHRMGDMGYLDEQRNLFFCGRKAHAVSTKEQLFYSVPTEKVFNTHAKVKRSALVALSGGEEAAVVIEPYPKYWPSTSEERSSFASELKELAKETPLTKSIEKVFFHPSFPVDPRHNAKIFRDKLSTWAEMQIRLKKSS